MRRTLPWVLVVLLAAGYGWVQRGEDGGSASTTARVLRVVDGDTILVAVGGRQERVRYIGVDTPETVKPHTRVQCFGKRASAANHRLVDGREVRLLADAEARDRYGRLLAYVYRANDGLFVNEALIRGGYATTLEIAPNVRFADRFAALARQARDAGQGLWSACER
jgi:micrococcal nuclease